MNVFRPCLVLSLAVAVTPLAAADQPPLGYLDAVEAAAISGWAYDPDAGTAPVDVHVYVDGLIWAIARADQRRDDLVMAGVAPNAEHGFWCNIAGLAQGSHQVAVYAIDAGGVGGNPQLSGSPRTVHVANAIPRGHAAHPSARDQHHERTGGPHARPHPVTLSRFLAHQVSSDGGM